MTPIEQARQIYIADPLCERDFDADLAFYKRHGYVFDTPELFMMGAQRGNAWRIHVAAGQCGLHKFLELMPYELPFVEWHRRGDRFRRYSIETIRRKLNHGLHTSRSTPAA